ncbi:MAG TPA: DUF3570 domain-containing protein, partial [Planctomycetaceae bacterium]|nr:DUF3570 domain-containing protein [Planctomycetaceae bacterium]
SARTAGLVVYLYLATPKLAVAEENVSVKWQDYSEDDGRIRVISKYLGFEKAVSNQITLRGHAVHDSISGATPTGEPAEDGVNVPLGELVDTRDAGVIDLDWSYGIHKSTFEYAYSSEPDYLSRGYSFTQTSEFNKRNTGLTYGISRLEDDVRPSFFTPSRDKSGRDYILGISQVVDPNTIVALNFTYSDYSGYLSDPYKIVRKDTEVFPGVFFPLTYAENRPDDRARRIWFFNVKRFFDKIGGSLDADYRYFDDTWGIESHTFDIEWYQKIGDKLIIRPKYRYYTQNAANFYTLDLSGSSIDPDQTVLGQAPHYSADYRLAKFDTRSYGLKFIYKFTERYSLDAAFERYEMDSKDATPQSAFADADILTIGGSLWF